MLCCAPRVCLTPDASPCAETAKRFATNRTVRLAVSLSVAVVLIMLATTFPSYALPQFLSVAKSTYTFKSDGVIDKQSCMLCHAGATNAKSLNAYGKDLQSAIKASGSHTVDAALLHKLDEKDSDGDGFPNRMEFQQDTLPGDATSKPAGAPPSAVGTAPTGEKPAVSNPFGLKALLFPEHAQHPVIVHFPIGLFLFSLFLDAFGIWKGDRKFNAAAYLNLIGAAVTGVLAVVTGIVAWRVQFQGEALTGDPMLMYHLVLAVTTTVCICLLWAIRSRVPTDASRPFGNVYIILGVLTFLVITITGHLGGVVSGVVK